MTLTVYPQLIIKETLPYRPYQGTNSAYEGGVNCACAGGAALVAWATNGTKKPTHHAFRIAAGNPKNKSGLPTGLGTAHVLKALTYFGVKATRYSLAHYSIVKEALQDGHAVGLCADYPTVNAWQGGKYSGQLTFKGGHFLTVRGFRKNDERVGYRNSTTDHDSLFDGRTRKWGTAPKGPQIVPFGLIRATMRNFRIGSEPTYAEREPLTTFGKDLGIFIVVERSAA